MLLSVAVEGSKSTLPSAWAGAISTVIVLGAAPS